MSKRKFEQLDEFEDLDDFDEYSLTLGSEPSNIKIKERPKKWSKMYMLQIFMAVVGASFVIYFFGSWLYMQFNHYMGM